MSLDYWFFDMKLSLCYRMEGKSRGWKAKNNVNLRSES